MTIEELLQADIIGTHNAAQAYALRLNQSLLTWFQNAWDSYVQSKNNHPDWPGSAPKAPFKKVVVETEVPSAPDVVDSPDGVLLCPQPVYVPPTPPAPSFPVGVRSGQSNWFTALPGVLLANVTEGELFSGTAKDGTSGTFVAHLYPFGLVFWLMPQGA